MTNYQTEKNLNNPAIIEPGIINQVDKIEEMLEITDQTEMDTRIYKNIQVVTKILKYILKRLTDTFLITSEETDWLIYCLKFMDTLNIFMSNQTIEAVNKIIYDINELVLMINDLDQKDLIIKKIRYTAMTIVYYKKKQFRNLFFTDGNLLGIEIENNLKLVTQNGTFDHRVFKQLQNVFWVVQNKIEEIFRNQLQLKMNEMKILCQKSKKDRFNYYEEYDDYADYKNFSNNDNEDYYDNFKENNSNSATGNINEYNVGINTKNNYAYNQGTYENNQYGYDYNNQTYDSYNNYYGYNKTNSGAHQRYNKNTFYNNRKGSYNTTNENYYKDSSNQGFLSDNINQVDVNKVIEGNNNNNENALNNIPTNGNTNYENVFQNQKEENTISYNNTYGAKNTLISTNTKTPNDVEVITTVINSANGKNPKQNYYNENFFKNYAYYNYKSPNVSNKEVATPIVKEKENNNLNKKNKNKRKKKMSNATEEANSTQQSNNNLIENVVNEEIIIKREIIVQTTIESYHNHNINENKTNVNLEEKQDNIKTESISNNNNIEQPEVISVTVNSNKNKIYTTPYNNNYTQKTVNNPNYKYTNNSNNYYNNQYSNQYSNTYNNTNNYYQYNNNYQKNYYNNKDYTNLETPSVNINQNKYYTNESDNSNPANNNFNLLNFRKFNNNDKTNQKRNGYNNTNTKYNKGEFKHEFVDLDELNKKKQNQEKVEENIIQNNENTSQNLEKENIIITNINIKNEEEKIIPKIEEIQNKNISIEDPSKKGLVDLDVEKMFSKEFENQISPKNVVKEKLSNNNLILSTNEINYANPSDSNEIGLEEDESDVNDLEDEVNPNEEEEQEEDSESEDDKEMIEAEFDKFMRESNLMGNNKNYNEDYYVDNADKSKNNKVIFEDDQIQNTNKLIKEDSDSPTKEEVIIQENVVVEGDSKIKERTKNFMDSLKTIDPKVLDEIKSKLNEEGKKVDDAAINNIEPNNMYDESIYNSRQYNKLPMQNFIFSNYAHFFYRGRDANIHREYFALKCLEQENSTLINKNLETFENKILIPIYQRINFNVNKKRGIYFYTFTKYKKLIYRMLGKDKILKKVKPYGSYMNNFLIDSGDIDICIVPKCGILEFSNGLEKIKEEIISQNFGEHKLTHHNSRYMLLKIVDNQTKFVIDITVHNMLPILNTNLIRLYSLYDQRFHMLGLYIKHWGKINKIHGAADNFLSSYAFILMLINFLQNVIEPKVLPNLQKVENKENIYEYLHNGETIKINIYYEEDLQKIRQYMLNINKGQENKDSATQLLIKFFEYYSYFFDHCEQKLSIHSELKDCIKKQPDNIAFSIIDPFDPHHNPGKSMTINSPQYNKFMTSMKKEINFILNGEYVKRLEKVSGNKE